MNGESSMETYAATYEIDGQWEFVVFLRELKLGLCDNPEGWGRVGGGREGGPRQRGDTCTPMLNSC